MHELPAVSNKNNAWFTCSIFSDWFFKHFVPEVRHYQENVLSIAVEVVKALLVLDIAPALPDAEKLIGADGKIFNIFPPT